MISAFLCLQRFENLTIGWWTPTINKFNKQQSGQLFITNIFFSISLQIIWKYISKENGRRKECPSTNKQSTKQWNSTGINVNQNNCWEQKQVAIVERRFTNAHTPFIFILPLSCPFKQWKLNSYKMLCNLYSLQICYAMLLCFRRIRRYHLSWFNSIWTFRVCTSVVLRWEKSVDLLIIFRSQMDIAISTKRWKSTFARGWSMFIGKRGEQVRTSITAVDAGLNNARSMVWQEILCQLDGICGLWS